MTYIFSDVDECRYIVNIKTKKPNMVQVKSDLYFSGIDGPTFFAFSFSTRRHRAVYKEAER
jgi:hypothetical protein